jgi:hypothetical protein
MDLIIYILACWSAIGADGQPARVPPVLAMAVWTASHHHEVDPYEAAAWLASEHKGRGYYADTIGRYNGGGERGLFQLKSVWAREATLRCSHAERYYAGKPDCLWIKGRVRFIATPRELRRGVAHLFDPYVNVEAGIIAIWHVKRNTRLYNRGADWRASLRCNKRGRTLLTASCRRSVATVHKWERRLRAHAERHSQALTGRSASAWP